VSVWTGTGQRNLAAIFHRRNTAIYLVGVIHRDLPAALGKMLRYRLGKRGTRRLLSAIASPSSDSNHVNGILQRRPIAVNPRGA